MSENKEIKQNFAVVNIYVKDISFEAPNSPYMFSVDWQPKVDFDLQMGSNPLGDDLYEAVLHLTVTTKLAVKTSEDKTEDKTAFLVEVKQAGVFSVAGFNEPEVEQILATTAQEILFPYAREAISSMVIKGGFPQMILPPVNFDALFAQHKAKQRQEAEKAKVSANEAVEEFTG